MRVLARPSRRQLLEFQRRGVSPKDALSALLSEAKARYPDAGTIIIQRAGDDFEIVALEEGM